MRKEKTNLYSSLSKYEIRHIIEDLVQLNKLEEVEEHITNPDFIRIRIENDMFQIIREDFALVKNSIPHGHRLKHMIENIETDIFKVGITKLFPNHDVKSECFDVFLSYLKEDKEKVDKLVNELENAGIKTWIDRKKLKPGIDWKNAIKEAIEEGYYFIACFSKNYRNKRKRFVNEELNLAIEQLRLIPDDEIWFIP